MIKLSKLFVCINFQRYKNMFQAVQNIKKNSLGLIVVTDLMVGVVVPAVPNVPEPRLAPEAVEPVEEDEGVEQPPDHSMCLVWN